ncbi:MAG: hypothetical protein OES69_11035 [Myxococcales bacterium]|nr:hypothetical protein [Myxococcales bacterium]
MREDTPKLDGVPFHFNEGSAKRRLFLTLGQRLLEQPPKAVLLPLDPQQIQNLLPRTRARNMGLHKYPTDHFIAPEPACSRKTLKVSYMRVGESYGESML